MTAEDKFGLVPERTVTFKRWTFSLREVIMGMVTLGCIFLVMLFAGLFGQKSTDLSATTSKLQSATDGACSLPSCFETMGYVEYLLNRSVDPCDNFFQFACGGFKSSLGSNDEREFSKTVLQQMADQNEVRLKALLTSGKLPLTLNTSSAERKLKDYYFSCTYDYKRETLKGTQFCSRLQNYHILSYLLHTNYDFSTWDLDTALKQVQTDVYVDALYQPRVYLDPQNSSRAAISIFPGGFGRYMRYSDYSTSPTAEQLKLQNAYKTFIKGVAKLLARDAGVPSNSDLTNRIQVFTDDTFNIETKLAKMYAETHYDRFAMDEGKKVSLDVLTNRNGSEINWVSQMSYMFNTSGVTGSTKIYLHFPNYLSELSAMIKGLDPQSKKRQLHNYLTWRVTEMYVSYLSYEYIHLSRHFLEHKHGYPVVESTEERCFAQVKNDFNIALGALYINTHFNEANKQKAVDITETVKTVLENTISTNTWMDSATKAYAIKKMKNAVYKIAYPDYMGDQSKVDAIYTKAVINDDDYLGNEMSMNTLRLERFNKYLREGEDRSQWFLRVYDTNMGIQWNWDEIMVPAGILRFPIYKYDVPHYYTFGSLGTLLGHFTHHLIDETGRKYDSGGNYMNTDQGWWSNQTMDNYNLTRQCVANVYDNITQGPYFFGSGIYRTIAVDGQAYANEAMAVTTGIRLAYNAYKLWVQKHGQDPESPGLKFTKDQLFFVGHAQVYCYNRNPIIDYLTTFTRNVNEEIRVNIALAELPEFKQTFGCSAGDNMVSSKPCTYY